MTKKRILIDLDLALHDRLSKLGRKKALRLKPYVQFLLENCSAEQKSPENEIDAVLKLWEKLTGDKIDYVKIWENSDLKFMIIEDLLGSKNEKGKKIFSNSEVNLISQLVEDWDISSYSNLDGLISTKQDGWIIYGEKEKVIPLETRLKFQRELKKLINDNILDKFTDLFMCLKSEFVQDVIVEGCYVQPLQTGMTRFSSGPADFTRLDTSDMFLNDDEFLKKYQIKSKWALTKKK